MRIEKANAANQTHLLRLMRESFEAESEGSVDEWQKTQTAINILLQDPLAGEAYLTYDNDDAVIGYIIMCRGFSLDYGGYFTWVEETYIRLTDQGRFRDKRFSP